MPERDLTAGNGPDRESAREQQRPEPGALILDALPALRDPVIVILALAGLFDGLSGNPIHSILLFAVALALTRDVVLRRRSMVPAEKGPLLDSNSMHLLTPVMMVGALVFAVLVGGFARYSWPTTVMVTLTGAGALAVAWRGPIHGARSQERLDPVGFLAWSSVFVGLGLWELLALVMQPTWTTDSRIHPTISVLTDPALSTHPGRSLALFAWLGLGWFLVQR